MNHFISFPTFLIALASFIAADIIISYYPVEIPYTAMIALAIIVSYLLFRENFRKGKEKQ